MKKIPRPDKGFQDFEKGYEIGPSPMRIILQK